LRQQVSAQVVYDFLLLQHNSKLFSFVYELRDLLFDWRGPVTGRSADQPNNLKVTPHCNHHQLREPNTGQACSPPDAHRVFICLLWWESLQYSGDPWGSFRVPKWLLLAPKLMRGVLFTAWFPRVFKHNDVSIILTNMFIDFGTMM